MNTTDNSPIEDMESTVTVSVEVGLSVRGTANQMSSPSRYVIRNSEILGGEPIITGTRTSVRAIVSLWRLGIMPEEILNHLPHLTLAQVFDALSFYQDEQAEINNYIERNQVPDELVHSSVKSALGKP